MSKGDVQGTHYGIESMTPVVFFAKALRENTFEYFFGHPYLKSFPTFILYNTIEGGTFVNFGDSWLEIYRYNVGLLRLASEYKDHYLQWIVKKAWPFLSGNFLSCFADTVFVFLWFDPTVEPIPPEELPSDHLFNGIGWTIFRTGWSKDDMLLAFKSGIRSRINTWDILVMSCSSVKKGKRVLKDFPEMFKQAFSVYPEFTQFLVRAGIDSVSINPDAAVFIRKLVASIEQRVMLEKALGQFKVDPDWDLPDPDEE